MIFALRHGEEAMENRCPKPLEPQEIFTSSQATDSYILDISPPFLATARRFIFPLAIAKG